MRKLTIALGAALVASAAVTYQQPPEKILDVLHAPTTQIDVSPARAHVLLLAGR